jgi:hypothetical protein
MQYNMQTHRIHKHMQYSIHMHRLGTLPTPLSPTNVPLPPGPNGRGHKSQSPAAKGGRGVSIPTTLEKA